MRVGDVRLDEAGDHVHRRPLRREDQVDARGARLLRQARDQLLDLLADDHHQVGELVDDHDDVRQRLEIENLPLVDGRIVGGARRHQRIADRLAGVDRLLHLAVEAGDVAHAERRHELVAPLHLGDAPAQRVGRLLHVGDDRREQVRDALVDRELEHLRVDHDQAHVLGGGLVEQRQHHRVDCHRLARAGGAGDQQVRHARQVRDHRLAADVLAERQRERRGHLVVGRDLMISPSVTISRFSFGISRPMTRLAGDDLDDAHADSAESARARSLASARDLARLDARRRPQLEARDHRTRLHRDHLDLDAEVLELQFDQARHRLERLRRIQRLARRRIVEQLQRRQLAGVRRIEQRHLPFLLDALALLHHRRRRLDARRARGSRLLLLGLARPPRAPAALTPFGHVARATRQRVRSQPRPRQATAPEPVHHGEPGDAGRRPRCRAIQAASSSSVAPRKSSHAASPSPTRPPDHAAGRLAQRTRPASAASPARSSPPAAARTRPPRTAVFTRDTVEALHRARCSAPGGDRSTTGNRKAGQPNRKNSTSATQAPTRHRSGCGPARRRPCRRIPGRRGS